MSARERKKALCLLLQGQDGKDLGGIVLLDQGNRRLTCDWFGTCNNQAVAAVVPREKRAAPQLACGTHLGNIFLSIWRVNDPPRLLVKDGSRLLERNPKVGG